MFRHKIVRNGSVFREYVDGSAVETSWQLDDVELILKIAGLSEPAITQMINELQATGIIEFEFQDPYHVRARLARVGAPSRSL